MTDTELKSAVEAIVFASGEPIPAGRISLALGVAEEDIIKVAEALKEEYESEKRGIRLVQMGDKLQLCSAPEYAKQAAKAVEERGYPKLSSGALEALAIVAYFQPVTRVYVEQIRGVDSSYTVNSLVDKGLIAPAGRLEAPGRPTLYKTTDAFLRVMGLSSLEELPELPDMSNSDGLEKLRGAIDALNGRGEQLEMELDVNTGGGSG